MIVTQTRVKKIMTQTYIKLAKYDPKTGVARDCIYKDGYEFEDIYEIGVYFRLDLLGTRVLGGVWDLYKYLCKKAYENGNAMCKVACIPEKLKKTPKTIKVHIEYLIDLGFIKRIPNGFYVSQIYYIKPNSTMPVKRTETRLKSIKLSSASFGLRRVKKLVKHKKNEKS
jgi:hypothetical protein